MLNYSLEFLAELAKGDLFGKNLPFNRVCIDSRVVQPGSLFIPIQGKNFNGYDFVGEAFRKGAVAYLKEAKYKPFRKYRPFIQVRNTRKTLGLLAAYHRQKFRGQVIGLTGSLGKTTTKAMIAAILRQRHSVLAPEASMNNNLGVPLTLLDLHQQDFALIEMGTNHFGEISYLTQMTKPDVALVTVIGAAHLQAFHNLAGVAQEKSMIFTGLDPDKIAVLNIDDPYYEVLQQVVNGRKTITFGLSSSAMVRATNIQMGADVKAKFNLITPDWQTHIHLECLGRHNVNNALAAAAVCFALGCSADEVQQGLKTVTGFQSRLVKRDGLKGSVILDDSYSAVPDAVIAALDVFANTTRQKIFVFGGMLELNPDEAVERHRIIGIKAKQAGVDQLLVLGDLTKHTLEGFGGGQWFPSIRELVDYLKPLLNSNVSVLIKGSRSMKLEKIVEKIASLDLIHS